MFWMDASVKEKLFIFMRPFSLYTNYTLFQWWSLGLKVRDRDQDRVLTIQDRDQDHPFRDKTLRIRDQDRNLIFKKKLEGVGCHFAILRTFIFKSHNFWGLSGLDRLLWARPDLESTRPKPRFPGLRRDQDWSRDKTRSQDLLHCPVIYKMNHAWPVFFGAI